MKRPKLTIICGLPGSGKTTLARQLQKETGAIRLCPDEWMDALAIDLYDEDRRDKIEKFQWKLGQDLLQQGVSVIVEWGTWGRSERDTLRQKAKELGAETELQYLTASAEVLFERIQKRGAENPPLKRSAIDTWFRIFQAPTSEEMALFDTSQTVAE